MSRLRWILAGVLALVAAVAAVQALLTYIEHHITVGVLAVLALLITLGVGLVSLAQARRRIESELGGLRARPAHGDLVAERLRRLNAIKAAGARPDPETLAETSAAEEAGRAYIGRYLVATTVLIGLVGTFAGLMETLGKVSPLLSDSGNGGLALLAAPLAGLHVTFGASLVAILATLALALVQGDLALHEELALAALGDLTTHELIPRMWPASARDDGAERTVQAIGELQKSFGELKQTFGDALVRSLEKGAGKLAAETRAESERAAKALEATAGAVEKQITRLCDTIATNLSEGARRQGAAITDAAAKQSDGLTRQATAFADSLSKSAALHAEASSKSSAAHAQALEALRAQLTGSLDQAIGQHGETLINTTNAVATRLGDAAAETLTALRAEWESAIARTTSAADAALRTSLGANEALLRQTVETAAAASLEATAAAKSASLEATAAAQAASLKVTEVAEQATLRGAAAAEEVLTRGIAAAQEATARAVAASEAASLRGAAAGEEAAARAAAATEEAVRRSITVCEETVRALSDRLGNSVEPLFATEADRLEAVREALVEISGRLDAAGGRLTEVTGAVAELGRGHTSALEETGKSVLAAFDRAVLGGGAALDAAAGTLAQAAQDLRAGTEGFAPTLGQLSADLASLGREVALMAARNPESDSSVVVLAELERLGTGVDRLTSLYEMAQMGPPVEDTGAAEAATAEAATAETTTAAETAAAETAAAAPGALADATDSDVAQAVEAMTLDDGGAETTADETASAAPGEPVIGAGDAAAAEAPEVVADAPPVNTPRAGRGKRKSRARDRAAQAEEIAGAPEAPAPVDTEAEALPNEEVAVVAAEEIASSETGAAAETTVSSAEIDVVTLPEEETGEAHLVGVHETSDDVPAVAVDRGSESDDDTDPNGETFLAAPTLGDGDAGGDPDGGTHS
jgi:hypothetical protein